MHLSRIAPKVANNVIATLPHQPACTAFVSAVDLKRAAATVNHPYPNVTPRVLGILLETSLLYELFLK